MEKYVGQCLKSLIQQTLKDMEIICINDGCTDQTREIIETYRKMDSRVRVLDKKNSGYGDSMNQGIEIASGKYIGIVESDDFVEPRMFEILCCNAERLQLDVSRATYWRYEKGENFFVEQKGVKTGVVYTPIDRPAIFYQSPSIWASVYRREWLNESKIRFLSTPGASFQDLSFFFKTNLMAERFMLDATPLLHYRIHDNNSVKSAGKVYAVHDELQSCLTYAMEAGMLEKISPVLVRIWWDCSKWNYRRLKWRAAWNFLKVWRDDMKHLIAMGISLESLAVGQRRKVHFLINMPKVFHLTKHLF